MLLQVCPWLNQLDILLYPFIWLTCTNKGASQVCEAALDEAGISRVQLQSGYLCDPASKSDLRILARPGVVVRLTRNLEKRRVSRMVPLPLSRNLFAATVYLVPSNTRANPNHKFCPMFGMLYSLGACMYDLSITIASTYILSIAVS